MITSHLTDEAFLNILACTIAHDTQTKKPTPDALNAARQWMDARDRKIKAAAWNEGVLAEQATWGKEIAGAGPNPYLDVEQEQEQDPWNDPAEHWINNPLISHKSKVVLFDDWVRNAKADAFDEGRAVGKQESRAVWAGHAPKPQPNPYREEQ